MSFQEQLKKARIAKGFTQQKMADLMGITPSTYCGYETGKRQPAMGKIKELAEILGVSVNDLLEFSAPDATRDTLDEIDIGFYGAFRELTEDDKKTILDMVMLMRERRKGKK